MVNYINITARKTITIFNGMDCIKLIDHVIFKTVLWSYCSPNGFRKVICEMNNWHVVKQQYTVHSCCVCRSFKFSHLLKSNLDS